MRVDKKKTKVRLVQRSAFHGSEIYAIVEYSSAEKNRPIFLEGEEPISSVKIDTNYLECAPALKVAEFLEASATMIRANEAEAKKGKGKR